MKNKKLRELIQKPLRFHHQDIHDELDEIKKQHHDHLICTKCGKIIEFMNDDLETLQEKISDKHQFRLDSHVMTLFGVCRDGKCQKK